MRLQSEMQASCTLQDSGGGGAEKAPDIIHLAQAAASFHEMMKCLHCPRHHWVTAFSSVAQSCPTLCDPINCSTPGLPVHHQLPELTQTHAHRVGDAIRPSHLPLLAAKCLPPDSPIVTCFLCHCLDPVGSPLPLVAAFSAHSTTYSSRSSNASSRSLT